MIRRTALVVTVIATVFCATAMSVNLDKIKPHSFDPPRIQAFENENLPWGYPSFQSDKVIYRPGYTMGYDFEKKTADWVCYSVRGKYYQNISYSAWMADPSISAEYSAVPSDYKKIRKQPSYEKGQLFPPELSRGSKGIRTQAFYMSNVLPMDKNLVDGPWKGLNKQIKYWSTMFQEMNVCAGPVFMDNDNDRFVEYDTMGANNVAVPDAVYVVMARYSADEVKPLAFVIPNSASVKKQQAGSYLTTVDRVEELTGLDFFPRLPDDVEAKIESEKNIAAWK